jgi:predicted DNA-binding protein (MmcQ/YjbR family)
MNVTSFYEYCLSKKGVTEHFPFDDDALVFKVGGKIFALTSLKKWENGNPTLNLKCNPERAEDLRNQFDGIQPGFHMNKKHWNTIAINRDVPNSLVTELIDHSYELVFKSLTIKSQNEFLL